MKTGVELLSFDATESRAGTTLTWRMADELDTLGFNVFREVNGKRAKLNGDLVAGGGFLGGAGESHAVVDPGPFEPGRVYWLEQVTFALDGRWYGPAAPLPTPGSGSAVVLGSRGGPTPTAAGFGPSASGESDDAGGCAIAASPNSAVALFSLALAMVALRRRRCSDRANPSTRRQGSLPAGRRSVRWTNR